MRFARILHTFLLVAASILLSFAGIAAEKKPSGSTLTVPSGAQVTFSGRTVTISPGHGIGNGGEWDCGCTGVGTCTVVQDRTGIECYKGIGDTCTAKCQFISTTTGVQVTPQ